MTKHQFGDLLRQIRESRGIHINDVATHLEKDPRTVYKWENGTIKPSFQSLVALTQFFDCQLVLDRGNWILKEERLDNELIEQSEKERFTMDLTLIQIRGTVQFYRDANDTLYQKLENYPEMLPVVEGASTYRVLNSFEHYETKYQLNGKTGYSVWYDTQLLKDNLWTQEEVDACIEEHLCEPYEVKVRPIFVDYLSRHLEQWIQEEADLLEEESASMVNDLMNFDLEDLPVEASHSWVEPMIGVTKTKLFKCKKKQLHPLRTKIETSVGLALRQAEFDEIFEDFADAVGRCLRERWNQY